MNFLKKIFIKLHVCNFSHPIVSKYISFNTRDIIYQCKCGKRKVIRENRFFDDPFPIQTSAFITTSEFEKILKSGKQ